jgi:hypothetical protein
MNLRRALSSAITPANFPNPFVWPIFTFFQRSSTKTFVLIFVLAQARRQYARQSFVKRRHRGGGTIEEDACRVPQVSSILSKPIQNTERTGLVAQSAGLSSDTANPGAF